MIESKLLNIKINILIKALNENKKPTHKSVLENAKCILNNTSTFKAFIND